MITAQAFDSTWRPLVRAARIERPDSPSSERLLFRYLEIHCDGVIEYGFVTTCERAFNSERKRLPLFGDFVIAQVAVVAGWIDSLREFAGAPCAEYAIEIAISVRSEQPLQVCPWGADRGGSAYELYSGGKLANDTQLVLGRRYPYTVGADAKALSSTLLLQVETDLCHAAGFECLDDHTYRLTSTDEE